MKRGKAAPTPGSEAGPEASMNSGACLPRAPRLRRVSPTGSAAGSDDSAQRLALALDVLSAAEGGRPAAGAQFAAVTGAQFAAATGEQFAAATGAQLTGGEGTNDVREGAKDVRESLSVPAPICHSKQNDSANFRFLAKEPEP